MDLIVFYFYFYLRIGVEFQNSTNLKNIISSIKKTLDQVKNMNLITEKL